MEHIPVLLEAVVHSLVPRPQGRYIDATVGDGGHTFALLEKSSPDGSVLGLDQDAKQLAIAKDRLSVFGSRVTLVQCRFSQIGSVASRHGFDTVDGILFDLGISSRQLSDRTYGLGFADDTPLDMRLSAALDHTAADLLNRANEQTIADVLYLYGDRHNSRTLARKILDYRRKQTFTVAYDLKAALGLTHPSQIAPVFQALRIWVNREYEELETALPQAMTLLNPGGKLLVISFHSGEDRIVKQFGQNNRKLLEVSKDIQLPTYNEQKANPRSRSAKLRVMTRTAREA